VLRFRIRTLMGRGRVVRRYDPRSTTRGTACLAWMCVQGDLKAVIYGQARWPSRPRSSATETFEEALKSYGYLGRDRQRNRGFLSGMVRGVSRAHEGSENLTFLFRSSLDCGSLLQLRSSWKANSANYFALETV
jgi:hypothetical protein